MVLWQIVKQMKLKYREFRDIFEATFCSREKLWPEQLQKNSLLLRALARKQDESERGFYHTITEIIEGYMNARYFFRGATLCLAFLIGLLWWGIPQDSGDRMRYLGGLVFLSMLIGYLLCSARANLPDYAGEAKLRVFLRTIVLVARTGAEHTHCKKRSAVPADVREILLSSSIEQFIEDTDAALVALAFQVKTLEESRVKTDGVLCLARDHWREVHSNAYELRIAPKDPKTYMDRAVPASCLQAAAVGPVAESLSSKT